MKSSGSRHFRQIPLLVLLFFVHLQCDKDLESSLQEGELKRKEAIRQLDISKQVFSKSRKEEFEDTQKTLESEWQSLVKSVKQMR